MAPKLWLPKTLQDSSAFKRTLFLPPESQDSFWETKSGGSKTQRASQMSKMSGMKTV